jgi:UbiD family decarboxylase
MKLADSLREHLANLESRGLLTRVSREINKDTELHPLVRWQFRGLEESQRRAFLFENVVDSRGIRYDAPVVVGALSASQEIYNTALGAENFEAADARWRQALGNPLATVLVEKGACQDVVHQGEDLLEHGGLDELPCPISTPGFDNAPYFNSAIWISKDPDTGASNAGIYRGEFKSQTHTGIFPDSNKDIVRMWEKHNARGTELEVAAVVGAVPAVYFAAVQIAPYGTDELAIAGALQGKPLEVVKCKTVDIEVPTHAEFVIEGKVRCDVLEPEGSFGEAHGYCDPRTLSLTFEVTAITHRLNPVFLSIISQLTPSESSKLKQAGYEARATRFLQEQCGLAGVQRVTLVEELLNRQMGVVTINKRDRFEPMTAMRSMLALRAAPKLLVAVDEDVDPRDMTAVMWAVINRSQPHRDVEIVHPRPLPFGPLRSAAGHGYDREDSALLIDATIKAPLPPVALPEKDVMVNAMAIWNELGLPELKPRAPWFGYSLGLWSQESADEARLATEGRYYETGAKLMGQQVPMPPGTKLADVDRHPH